MTSDYPSNLLTEQSWTLKKKKKKNLPAIMNKIAFAVKIWNVYRTQQYKTNPLI